MMVPEYLYYALVIGLAGTAAPFNRVALVVLAVWVLGQFAWLLGLPLAPVYLVIHCMAFVMACVVARNPMCAIVAALFIPIIATDAAELMRWISPHSAWWGRVYLGSAQLLLLWPAVKFDALLRAYNRINDRSSAHVERVAA
ncbi:hypothetical protein [Sphingomonas sp.]|uniref:hypothetical protein n=1 Tax=Sphingomonas sp. TaxID=28214 RepID=UPI0031DBFCE9